MRFARLSRTERRNRERGAAAVEFALVLPILIMLIFGIIDFGRMLNARITITEAAREGARAAALQTGEDAANTIDTLVGGMKTTMTPYVIVSCGEHPAPGQDATVTLNYRFEFVTPLAFFGVGGNGITLTQTAVMPCL